MQRSWLTELAGLPKGPKRFRPRLEALEAKIVPALAITDLTGGLTAAQVANALLGSGVTVSNVTYTGDNRATGLFTGGTGIIGFESGIILGTGRIADVIGPNNIDTSGTDLGQPGDADLTALASNPTNDAAVLEFDFVPASGSLTFDYVFGSEEYNELANNAVSDNFALFVNGQNVALVPNTSTPVTIDTVNLTMNSQFYVNNAEAGDATPATPPLLDTQLDGLTTVLTAQAQVNAGASNHIKLVIADVIDTDIDSAIFFRANSLTAPMPPGAASFTAYRPLRYAFRSLEENLGQTGNPPGAGGASEASFDGIITLLNTGNASATGSVRVTLRRLPAGVTLLNSSGNDVAGDPFILVQSNALPPGGTVPLRVPVKFSNPNLASLGTVFVGPYDIEVSTS